MRILIEEYPYEVADVKDILHGMDALVNVEGRVSIHYVGYYYNTMLKDCVFILPKVLLKGKPGKELAFGKYKPEDIVNLEEQNPLNSEERNFLYKFAVWIYRHRVSLEDCPCGKRQATIEQHVSGYSSLPHSVQPREPEFLLLHREEPA